MKCQNCNIENLDTRKFCHECGAKLMQICPHCGYENLPRDNFCGECGQNLTISQGPTTRELPYDEQLAKIQRYLPKGLTEKILTQRDRIEGERKQVTVMFCDMEGFTSLVQRLGPDEAYTIMDQIYDILIHNVHDYEGMVNEMTGDGIMALFGAFIAVEDAPQRAIYSALAIHRELVKFSDRLKQESGVPPIKMRIGIHCGPVVVGTLGNDLRVEFKAVGDTVNMAKRMEELAEPGTTNVTEEIFRSTEGFFRFEALGEQKVKGKDGPIKVYRVIVPSTRRTRFDVNAERGLTPFIGRERELELLLDGFDRSKTGRGQAFSIVAEAGVGKSRLLYEFRKAVSSENMTFFEGRCLSYSRGIAYHPFIDVLKSNFDIHEDDEDLQIRGKVKRGLKDLQVDESYALPYFLELLSVKDSGIDQIPMSAEARKDRIIEAIKRISQKGSEVRPLIIAIEDLHWIDKSSEDALKYLWDSISGARVLLIITYRPEFVHTWGGRSFHNQVNLNRLSNRESLTMVTHLLGTEEIEMDLENLILEKTEGVPFFIEEFIGSLKDLKVIERKNNRYYLTKDMKAMTIPSTIQDVIMARVDSLPEMAKRVLQAGSVIEREFSYELIKRATNLPQEELLSNLSALKDSELLYERGIYPQLTYVFKHALTREVVYDSILTKRKKMLHEKIGSAIEEIYKNNLDEHYGLLAEHFIASENYEKGARFSKLAARKSQKAASFKDAIEHAKKKVFCLEKLPKTEEIQKRRIDARTLLAGYYTSLSRFLEAKDAVFPIVDIAHELNYQKRIPGIYTAIGLYSLWSEEDFSKTFRYLNEVLNISDNTKDYVYSWFSSFFLGCALSWNCEFEKGLEYFGKSMDLSHLADNPILISYTKGAMTMFNHIFTGNLNLAYQTSEESLRTTKESGDIYMEGMAYTSYGTACYYKGLFDESENSLIKGSNFCERSNITAWEAFASGYLGHLYADTGEHEKAQELYKKTISILENERLMPSWLNHTKISKARAKVLSNDKNVSLNEQFEYYKNIKINAAKGWAARDIAEILLNIDDQHIDDTENWVKRAIEIDTSHQMMLHLGRDYALYADLLKRKGDKSRSKENLIKATEIFKECSADGYLKEAEKEFSSFS